MPNVDLTYFGSHEAGFIHLILFYYSPSLLLYISLSFLLTSPFHFTLQYLEASPFLIHGLSKQLLKFRSWTMPLMAKQFSDII